MKKARVIAFYLPQFHPIPENDEWWGKGFTEWTNVGKAKPLFKGHYQPKVPADLGYYDLRIPEVREAQAELARKAGIEGFMYWHYWFGNGKTLLERPFQEMLSTGKPDFPFCLGWANHSWENKTWDSNSQYKKSKMLMEQKYSGESDYKAHFEYVLPAFKDKRYMTIDGKPIFFVYSMIGFKEASNFIRLWRELAQKNGLKGIYFIGQAHRMSEYDHVMSLGFDGVCNGGMFDAHDRINGKYLGQKGGEYLNKIMDRLRKKTKVIPLNRYAYSDIVDNMIISEQNQLSHVFPAIVANFDHTPRSGHRGLIYDNSTPALFQKLLHKAIDAIKNKEDDHKIIFLRSWNEWAEGNYVEPDLKYGKGYLEAIEKEIF